jgi:hypothetical protein
MTTDQRQDLTKDQKQARQQSQLSALKEQQIREKLGEDETEYVSGNRNSSFKIRALEADGYVHIHTRIKHLANDQKSFVNEDRTIKIHAREFDARVKNGAFKTYDEVEVVHDPRKKAPTVYNLKPDGIPVAGGNVQDKINAASGADKKAQEKLEREKLNLQKNSDALEKKKEEVNAQIDELNEKEKQIISKAQELEAKEKAIAEREAKLNAAPVEAPENSAATNTETATTAAPKK